MAHSACSILQTGDTRRDRGLAIAAGCRAFLDADSVDDQEQPQLGHAEHRHRADYGSEGPSLPALNQQRHLAYAGKILHR